MIAAIVVLVFFLTLIFLLVWRVFKGRHSLPTDIHCASPAESELDIDILNLLLSARENEYLRNALPIRQFRVFKRRRIILAWKYLRALSRNTSELIRVAEAARSSPDSEIAQAAQELLQMAFRVKLNVPIVRVHLLAEWLFPALSLSIPPKLNLYRDMAQKTFLIFHKMHHDRGAQPLPTE